MRLKDAYVIWTVYFHRKLSRRRGRRLPRKKAIQKPTLNELKEAAEKLGLEIIEIKKARYPACWWIESGYITVKKPLNINKSKLIDKISYEIRRGRGGG